MLVAVFSEKVLSLVYHSKEIELSKRYDISWDIKCVKRRNKQFKCSFTQKSIGKFSIHLEEFKIACLLHLELLNSKNVNSFSNPEQCTCIATCNA